MKAKVTIDITYDFEYCSSDKDIKHALYGAVNYLANAGLLSDEESIVDTWSSTIEVTQ
tara:strand:- start:880 stop:1053 length:174 start_codon:yes stop_codon:yes gene_type:complete